MKNEQLNLGNTIITYIEKEEELYQHMKLSGLCQCFMMTQPKHIKMQTLCITISQKDTFGKI